MAPGVMVLIGEVAHGGGGTGDNILTRYTRNEHDRAVGHRVTFGPYAAPSGTR